MSRPWKHPQSGIYWLRKGVPIDLRAILGKREEKRSLQTRDPVEAKRKHAEVLAELESRWANLRAGPKLLTELEAHRIAAPLHDRWLAQYRENPSSQTFWDTAVGPQLFKPSPALQEEYSLDIDKVFTIRPTELRILRLEQWCLAGADEYLAQVGMRVEEPSRRAVAKAIAMAIQRASVTLERLASGAAIENTFFAQVGAVGPSSSLPSLPVSFDDLLKGWTLERQPVAKTIYEWSRVVRQLEAFLGHDDARRVTADDIVRWKRSMVEAGLRPKTIQDAKLAPVRAIFEWGYRDKRLQSNPADGISIEAKTKPREKKRGFTDEEARIILAAAAAETNEVRKWVPWIGAYSGARVSEICQLRCEDVLQIEDVWCMKLVPEAGSLKNSGSERIVPLHPALIEAGFVSFATRLKNGSLFPKLKPDKFGKRGGNGTKVVGRFVRQLGLTDPRLSPNHSWRHRIKTSGRRYGLAKDILDAITGHSSGTEGDAYGEFPAEALLRELSKIPHLKL